MRQPYYVSIHALARRATRNQLPDGILCFGFNSRPRAEGDVSLDDFEEVVNVSIHALARRATINNERLFFFSSCFNSRPRAEGDGLGYLYSRTPILFQFTPSRGGRRRNLRQATESEEVSIHALARRATFPNVRKVSFLCFNSRPRAEGDCILFFRVLSFQSFNSRPRAEGDVYAVRPRADK